jgi:mannose-1-phosphate guanylyltransferase/mannose-6-phosphate isomerase
MANYPVILSGGTGTRLWPLSRALYPKQFIRFLGEDQPSFLGATLRRLAGQGDFAAPILIGNNSHRFLLRAECETAGIDPQLLVLEAEARNTAPAIAAAAHLVSHDRDAILCVMPSDHVIGDTDLFVDAMRQAAAVAGDGRLVLFGIRPTEPHTGYGYIQQGERLEGAGAYQVAGFTEKPDLQTAAAYLESGQFLWNSGIFVLHAAAFLEELARFEPAVFSAVRDSVARASTDLGFLRLEAESFARSPSISVDYAVMERTDRAAVIPLTAAWNDVGSWKSLWDLGDKDAEQNLVRGDALLIDTDGTMVQSERSLVATLGVHDLIIVDTPDALLVADRHRSQDVGSIVAALRLGGRREHEQHIRNHRPWGFFESLSLGPGFQVKLLHVKPGCQLSMQMHHHRSEHWIVVKGTAQVTVGDKVSLVRENESLYINAAEWHRLGNPGEVDLDVIEVQIGSYLGEDDIIRSEDVYNRDASETR